MTEQQPQTPPNSPRPPQTTSASSLRSWGVMAALSFLVVAIAFAIERSGFLSSLNLHAYDALVALQHPEPASDTVFNVDFDGRTVRDHNWFPIPRLVLGVDIILDRPRLQADDAHLAKVIDDAGNVILVSEHGFNNREHNDPLQPFQQAAAGVAFGDLPVDEDGAVRRMFLRVTTITYKALSLPVALADFSSDKHLRPGGDGFLLFGGAKLPLASTDPDTAWVNFRLPVSTHIVSVDNLLAKNFDPSIFAGKVVLVGQSSEMGKDLFDTPATRAGVTIGSRDLLSGAEIHGAAVASLLSGRFFSTVSVLPRLTAGFLLALVVVTFGYRYRWHVALAACLLLAACTVLVAFLLFSRFHLWMPLVSIEACLLGALPAGLGYRSVEERRLKNLMEAERRQLMGLFERYVSADVAAEIWKNRDAIVLAGEERVATILFSDIRSFTAMTAGVPSKEVLAWLNRYLTVMGDVIKKHRGFLNKFIGDGIMVVFGAPLSEGPREDACRAVRCAVEMLARVDQWNATKAPSDPVLKIGIGIHTGTVTSGNVGSPDRLEYSVIGETVNLASRLEALTKEFKTPLVLSPAAWEHIRSEFSTVSLGDAQVRGFTNAIPLYSVEFSAAVAVPNRVPQVPNEVHR
jgi:adenylate cyclase